MSFKEFSAGYRSVDPNVTDEQLQEAFGMADSDASKRLSWEEFERLFDGEQQGPNPDEVWGQFVTDAT
jgi:hypothetical protein